MTTALRVSEAQWLVAVGDTLDLYGWSWHHARPARRKDGKWATAVQGNSSKGFPDIIAARPPRLLAIELKSATGRTTPEQREWIARLQACGVEAHVLRMPAAWDSFVALTAPDPQQMSLTSNSTGAQFAVSTNERYRPL